MGMNTTNGDGALARESPLRRLLRTKEAAVYLAISDRKLWELTNTGELPHLRIGRSVRYCPEDLEQWITEQREKERIRHGPRHPK